MNIHRAECRRRGDTVMIFLICLAAVVVTTILVGMLFYVFVKGIGIVNLEFLTSVSSEWKGTVGIAGNLLNTLYMIGLTLLVATPLGIGSAIYLNEYARPGRFVRLIEFTTETLSGIPSILYGLFGMVFFGTICKLGYSLLTGAFTLSIMILPLITRNTQEALRTVPNSYRKGALGMGASKWYMIRTILLPCATSGIITGVILAIGRIVGESAALLFTAGSSRLLPKWTLGGLMGKVLESGGTLAIELYLSMSNGRYDVAFGIATVLLFIVLAINLITKMAARRFQAKWEE